MAVVVVVSEVAARCGGGEWWAGCLCCVSPCVDVCDFAASERMCFVGVMVLEVGARRWWS